MIFQLTIFPHILQSMDDNAPWAYSSLLTKYAGGFSKKLFSGPTYAAEHIFKSFLCRNFCRNYAQIHSTFAPDKVREFYESLNDPLSTNT